jgi:hypothetical protein
MRDTIANGFGVEGDDLAEGDAFGLVVVPIDAAEGAAGNGDTVEHAERMTPTTTADPGIPSLRIDTPSRAIRCHLPRGD